MEQIYEKNLWGGNNDEFYSGFGSHQSELVKPYLDVVSTFLISFEEPLIVCDLGCGDFNIGKELVQYSKKYIAVDIAENLIQRNKETFKSEKIEFHCRDIAKEELPKGDCAILRNVLQHLSNKEVKSIIEKLGGYKYVILTEHLPRVAFIPNKDIISGQGIRLKKQSGIDLLAPPFNFEVKETKELLSISLEDDKGVIVTKLYIVY
ncbi:MAG: class I SAM-dependent methyltransferase [Balneolaceae bacterium]|nr:class I SAM-dependent methyltransferase [Balneolaceae bacterium]MBO6547055.1 class I SAM-dependent methyltransferase [Balneolaceae bacterium]MBO6647998.1 class I SAM-dependent methyltransferase [Balneolaceae bacterium]